MCGVPLVTALALPPFCLARRINGSVLAEKAGAGVWAQTVQGGTERGDECQSWAHCQLFCWPFPFPSFLRSSAKPSLPLPLTSVASVCNARCRKISSRWERRVNDKRASPELPLLLVSPCPTSPPPCLRRLRRARVCQRRTDEEGVALKVDCSSARVHC